MRKLYLALTGVAAIGICAASAMAFSKGKTLKADLIPSKEISSFRLGRKDTSQREKLSMMSDNATVYWNYSTSYYDKNGIFSYDEGEVFGFTTGVEFDGENVSLTGLFDLFYDIVLEEYPINGKYDFHTNTITISGTGYDDEISPDNFISVAKMQSASTGDVYYIKLFAGEMMPWGDFETKDELVFSVSEDLSSINSLNAYGAFAFDASGTPMGFYTSYRESSLTRSSSQPKIMLSVDDITFPGKYVCAGLPVTETISLINLCEKETTYNISSDLSQIIFTTSQFTVPACSEYELKVTMNALETGLLKGSVFISAEGMETVALPVTVEVQPRPDYSRIVKAGEEYMSFQMMEPYPFVIEELDGKTVAISTNEGEGNNTHSGFDCDITIPEGKTGIFSWKAEMVETQPNTLIVSVDGVWTKYDMYNSIEQPVDMSGTVALLSGMHKINFDNAITIDWSAMYGKPAYSYVWDLELILTDAKENDVYMPQSNIDFGKTYFDKYPVAMTASVELLNTGTANLYVTGFDATSNFNGIIPDNYGQPGSSLEVTLTWEVSKIGEDNGEVVIHTSAGDLTVYCAGLAEPLPADYEKFAQKGEFSFNTSVEYPFVVSDNGLYLYNSSSLSDIAGPTDSWIEASFEVAEDQIGKLSWDAVNDSEKVFEFMGIPSLISGTVITIDGEEKLIIGGENALCGSSQMPDPTALIFTEGLHNIRFTYHKTSNDPDYIFGDDRLKLFGLALDTFSTDEFKGLVSEESIEFPQPIFSGCVGHYPAYIVSYCGVWPEILSTESDGPFSVKTTQESDDRVFFNVEFAPVEAGSYENELIIHTEIGDFSIMCSGTAIKSDLGQALFYEGFEYDFENNWIFEDKNSDANTWQALPGDEEWFYGLAPYEGAASLILVAYDPTTFNGYEMDDYAMTPEINLPADGVATLRFMIGSQTYDLQFDILVGVDTEDPAEFTKVKTFTWDGPDYWQPCTVDLSEYNGKKIRIAFHSQGVDSMNDFVVLDDILVASTGSFDSGVNSVVDSEIINIEYVSLDGIKSLQPHKGINIVVTNYSDGKVKVSKKFYR